MKLRFAIPSDLNEMQRLYVETIRTVCSKDYNQEQIDVWTASVQNQERWNAILKDQIVIIAEKNNKITGFGTLRDNDYIDLFYIHKDFQRVGIGNSILSQIEVQAKKSRNNILTSDVSITAKSFFEKMGFTVIKEQKNGRGDVMLTNYKMEKKI